MMNLADILSCETAQSLIFSSISSLHSLLQSIKVTLIRCSVSPYLLHCSFLNRRLHRQHLAECSGCGELCQAPVGRCCPGWTGERVHNADLSYSLHAAASPRPSVSTAPAVCQTAERGWRHGDSSSGTGSHVELHRKSPELLLCRFPAAWNGWQVLGWMHELEFITVWYRKIKV